MELNTELRERLDALAFKVTENFCYSCYRVVKGRQCPSCGTDDFMRYLEGVGVEYGTDWIIEHLIKENCSPVDLDQEYEELLNECYEPVKIGTCQWDAGYVIKELDPVTFNWGIADMVSDNEQYAEIDGQYYSVFEIENMIDELS